MYLNFERIDLLYHALSQDKDCSQMWTVGYNGLIFEFKPH